MKCDEGGMSGLRRGGAFGTEERPVKAVGVVLGGIGLEDSTDGGDGGGGALTTACFHSEVLGVLDQE